MITDKEAAGWLDNLTREQQIEILKQFHAVKEGVCARVLGVATASDWWVQAATERAEQLRTVESCYNTLVHGLRETLEETTWRTQVRKCFNCLGKKTVGDHSCVICKGTGIRYL